MAALVGSVRLQSHDVQRLHKETAVACNNRIEHGRRILAAWLSLVRLTSEPVVGCEKCGRPGCDNVGCRDATNEIISFSARVPLEGVHTMDAPRWRTAMNAVLTNKAMAPLRKLTGVSA